MVRRTIDEMMDSGSRFPFANSFQLGRSDPQSVTASQIIDIIGPIISKDRIAAIEKVCQGRSFDTVLIAERLYDMGNLSAVCRSSDAMGFGGLHYVTNRSYKQSKRSSAGAHKWLDVQVWDETADCLAHVKSLGYQVLATHLSEDAISISEVDWTKPTAIIMGNEKQGVSPEALAAADARIIIPMDGFVDSYNISVASALLLWEAKRGRLEKLGHHGNLSEAEREILKAVYFLRHKGRAKQFISELLNRPPPEWQRFRGGWEERTCKEREEVLLTF